MFFFPDKEYSDTAIGRNYAAYFCLSKTANLIFGMVFCYQVCLRSHSQLFRLSGRKVNNFAFCFLTICLGWVSSNHRLSQRTTLICQNLSPPNIYAGISTSRNSATLFSFSVNASPSTDFLVRAIFIADFNLSNLAVF